MRKKIYKHNFGNEVQLLFMGSSCQILGRIVNPSPLRPLFRSSLSALEYHYDVLNATSDTTLTLSYRFVSAQRPRPQSDRFESKLSLISRPLFVRRFVPRSILIYRVTNGLSRSKIAQTHWQRTNHCYISACHVQVQRYTAVF